MISLQAQDNGGMRVMSYQLKIQHDLSLVLPEDAIILGVQIQNDDLTMYCFIPFIIDKTIERRFILVGTGNIIYDKKLDYIGTIQQEIFDTGLFRAFHLFEVLEED